MSDEEFEGEKPNFTAGTHRRRSGEAQNARKTALRLVQFQAFTGSDQAGFRKNTEISRQTIDSLDLSRHNVG